MHRKADASLRTVLCKENAQFPPTSCAYQLMTFLLLGIPIMLLAVAIAAVPLFMLTARQHRFRTAEVHVNHRQSRS
jgi:hypothetical protein